MLGDEVGNNEARTLPLPMSIERNYILGRGPRHPKHVQFSGLPGCLSAQISAELWCVMLEDEVGDDETRTLPLPMVIERKDKR